jgi:hypothetical protein
LIVTVAGRLAARCTAEFEICCKVEAVLLSNGFCVTTPLLIVVCFGPCSAASYLNASLSIEISRAEPMRLPQCAL